MDYINALMNETVEIKYILILIVEYAISFFVFGYICGTNKAEDKYHKMIFKR